MSLIQDRSLGLTSDQLETHFPPWDQLPQEAKTEKAERVSEMMEDLEEAGYQVVTKEAKAS